MNPKHPERKKPMVYVVDDDSTVLNALRIVLRRDFLVEMCDNAIDAVVDIERKDPDILVLDIRMPERDGFWLLCEVRNFNPDIPIIFNSAYQDTMSPEDLKGAFAPFAHLPKSGNFTEFQNTMWRAAKVAGWDRPPSF